MPQRVYTLRDPYKDTFVGGHVTTGVEGQGVNLHDLLSEGNGEISTDDAMFQSVLENYYGAEGLVFDVAEVQGDERVPVNPTDEGGVPLPPVPIAPASTPTGGEGTAAAMPEAQHGEQSEYANMPMNELREIAAERQMEVPTSIKKDDLVGMLEQHDAGQAQQ